MKKRTGNNKVMRAIAVALATMIAVTSVPVTTYAEDPEEQPIVVENLIKEADHDNSNDENKNDPGPGVSQLIDTAQSSMETATDKKPSEGNIESQDPATAAQGYLNAAAGKIDAVVTDLNNFKNANNTANQAASQYAQEIKEAVDNAAAVVFVPEVDDQNNPVYVQATDEDGNLLYEDEEQTIPKYVQAVDPETGEPMWADEAKTIPVYEQKMKAVPVGNFKTASETTENKSQSAIDNSDIANKSGNESVARKAQADANADLEDAKKGLTDANTAIGVAEKAVDDAWGALTAKQAELDAAEKQAKAAQETALGDAIKDSKAANDNLKLCQDKVSALEQEFDKSKVDLIKAYSDLMKISDKIAEVRADESKTEEEKQAEIKKLDFNTPGRTLTKLLIAYYIEQQEDYQKGTQIYVGIGADGKPIGIKEQLVTSYEKDQDETTKDGNPWQNYKEVKNEVTFPEGVDGKYGYFSRDGWIFSNDYLDNCVVVQYTNTAGETVYKYYNFKPVNSYKDQEIKESGASGSLFFYEREFSVDHNGEEYLPDGETIPALQIKPQIGIDDFYVDSNAEGTAFSAMYNEEKGNLNQVIDIKDEETEEVIGKLVPDFDSSRAITNTQFNYNPEEGVVYSDKEDGEVYPNEYEIGNTLVPRDEPIVEEENENNGKSASRSNMIDEVSRLLDSYKDEKDTDKIKPGYSISIVYDTWLQHEELTIDNYNKKPSNFWEWIERIPSAIDDWAADKLNTASYKIVVNKNVDEVEGVVENVYKDVDKTTTTNETPVNNKVGNPKINVKKGSIIPIPIGASIENGGKTAAETKISDRGIELKNAGYIYDEETHKYVKTENIDGVVIRTEKTLTKKQGDLKISLNTLGESIIGLLSGVDTDEFYEYIVTESTTIIKTETIKKQLVATNHYGSTEYKKVYQEKIVGHDQLILDKGIKWLDDYKSIQKAISNGSLKGTKEVEALKKKYDDLQKAKNDLDAAKEKADALEGNVKKLQEQMQTKNYVDVDRSALEELSLKLELETERLEEARKKKAKLEERVREAQRAVDSIDLSRFIPVDDDDDDRPSSPGTPGGVFTLPSGIEVIPLAAAPASGVAGVRTGRRNSGTVASNNSGVLGVRTEGSDTTKKEDVELDNKDEEKTESTDKDLKKVDNPTSPLAATPYEEGAGINWLWLLAAAAAAGAGVYGYGKHRKAVAANDEAKKYKK